MCGTEVLENASTAMPPFAASRTPAASSPMPSTLGMRPVANMTCSTATSSPSDSCARNAPVAASTPAAGRPGAGPPCDDPDAAPLHLGAQMGGQVVVEAPPDFLAPIAQSLLRS